MRRETTIRTLAVVAMMTSSSALALGSFPPGYIWGLAYCGPAVNCSRIACRSCCERAGQNGEIDPDDVFGCKQMCDESVFNCPGWFSRVIRWTFV